jgi:hypothetical protein
MSMDEKDIYGLDNDEEPYAGEDQEEGDELEDHVIYHHFYGF